MSSVTINLYSLLLLCQHFLQSPYSSFTIPALLTADFTSCFIKKIEALDRDSQILPPNLYIILSQSLLIIIYSFPIVSIRGVTPFCPELKPPSSSASLSFQFLNCLVLPPLSYIFSHSLSIHLIFYHITGESLLKSEPSSDFKCYMTSSHFSFSFHPELIFWKWQFPFILSTSLS